MVYLDNAATSLPKPITVLRAVNECIEEYCANSGRSSHRLAMRCSDEIYAAREAVARHFCMDDPSRTVFVTNATYALNTAIKTMIPSGAHVLISELEHNAVLRPVEKLKREGKISYSVFSTRGDIHRNIKKLITPKTAAIVSTLCSNVSGAEIPIDILSTVSRENGLIFIADASQIAGHKRIDLSRNPCDALCAPAHKGMLGIQGCGFICFAGNRLPTKSFIEGGTGSHSLDVNMPIQLPDLLEGGTLPTPAIVALRHGIDFIENIGLSEIETRMRILKNEFLARLDALDKIAVIAHGGTIISLVGKGLSNSAIISRLNDCEIATRGGLHCAPMAHRALGTLGTGTIRISLSVMNTVEDADALYKCLSDL